MSKRRWGLAPEEWEQAKAALDELLLDAASRGCTVTYGEAARRSFNGRFSARSGALMALLGDVDEEQQRSRGVMIASLVVRADTGVPGDGFFAFAHDVLGRDVSDRAAFWRAEAEAVWAVYGASGART